MLNVLPQQVETDGRTREREGGREREGEEKEEKSLICEQKVKYNRFASKYDILKFSLSLDVYCLVIWRVISTLFLCDHRPHYGTCEEFGYPRGDCENL